MDVLVMTVRVTIIKCKLLQDWSKIIRLKQKYPEN